MYVLEVAFSLDLGVTYSAMIVLPTAIQTSGYLCETSYRVQCCLREMGGKKISAQITSPLPVISRNYTGGVLPLNHYALLMSMYYISTTYTI